MSTQLQFKTGVTLLAAHSKDLGGDFVARRLLPAAQRIAPGAINWMTAGSGIVHSERRPEAERNTTYVNHGLQLLLVLPTHPPMRYPRCMTARPRCACWWARYRVRPSAFPCPSAHVRRDAKS